MSLTAFPSDPDLVLKFEDMVLDGRPKNFQVYDVSNPHPGYGKDPNILNEYGHTKYPMWVDGPNGRVIVNNEEDEKALFNPPSVPEVKPTAPASPWPSAK